MIYLLPLWQLLLRFGFRLLYNELAWTYDGVSWLVSLGAWRSWQLAALPFVQGPQVLEIAHGPGHMLLALHQAGYKVTGVDLSPFMGQQARRRLQRAGVIIPLIRADGRQLPLPTAVYDTVLVTFPTEFIIDLQTLTAVQRVLHPDGRLVIVPEGHLRGGSWLHGFITWLYLISGQRSSDFAAAANAPWPHETLWVDFRQRFAAAGLAIECHSLALAGSRVTVIVAQADKRPFGNPAPSESQIVNCE